MLPKSICCYSWWPCDISKSVLLDLSRKLYDLICWCNFLGRNYLGLKFGEKFWASLLSLTSVLARMH